jgi:hypothetical protein
MDGIEFHDIMDCTGHIQLHHPLRPRHFYVIEERVQYHNTDDMPEYMVFYVSPFVIDAVELQKNQDASQCLQFLADLYSKGWRMTDEEIPKYDRCRKWQFCRRIQNVLPQ